MNSSPLSRQVRRRPVLRSLYWMRDPIVVEADDAGVGESDAEDVAGEVVEHGLLAVAPGADVEDPWLVPDRVRDDEIRALLPQQGAEFAAHQRGERLDRQEELPPRRMPGAAVCGDPAATDQAMHMRVEVQLLGPGVQHREHRHGAADVARVARELDDRRGAGLHQHAIARALMGAQHRAQFSRDGDGDVEVGHRQHLRLTAFEPLLRLGGVALRATAIAAGVEREHLAVARLAAPDLAAEGGSAAVEDILDGAPMRGRHRRAVRREVVRREAAEHVGELDHDRASEAGHQPIEQIMQRRPGWRGEMGVDRRGGDAGMAEQDLHDADVDAVLDQSGCVGMAQAVRGHVRSDAGRNNRGGEGIRQDALIERRVTATIGEQPAGVVMGPPELAQLVEMGLPPEGGGVGSEHYAASLAIPSMAIRASTGV